MLFFILFSVAVVAAIIFSTIGYYSFWKSKKLNKPAFWGIFILLFANMILAVEKSKIIPFHWLKMTSYFFAILFFITTIYSSFLFIPKWLILKIADKSKHNKNKFIKFLSSKGKSTMVIFGIMCVVSIAGFINMDTVRQTNYTVKIPKASENSSIRAAVISDSHTGIGVNPKNLEKITEKINETNPDVIFMVGDIVDESTTDEDVETLINAFKKLKSKYGTYYVAGNHEGYANFDYNKYMPKAGITVLDDKTATIAGDITVIGRKDGYSQRKELSEIIKDENVDKSKPIITLNHEPLQLAKMADEGSDLTFCGHTHGEQFPFTKVLFSLANDMMYGQEKFSDMTAITTSGIGGWGFHFKLPAKSEIAVVNIEFNK